MAKTCQRFAIGNGESETIMKHNINSLEGASPPDLQSSATQRSAEPDPNAALKLFFIRHGETTWSRSGQFTGRTDIPLTAYGCETARQLGAYLRDVSFSHVLTSPLQRARQTGELAGLNLPVEVEPDLIEWDNGDDEGRTTAEILVERADWNLFRDGSPNGESPAQISVRVDRLIARLKSLTGNVALFSHSHVGRVLVARWIGLAVAQAQPFLLSTSSVSILGYQHDRRDLPAIELWNAVPYETFSSCLDQTSSGKTQSFKQQALERWENEGGETRTRFKLPHAQANANPNSLT